jgi:hypothetical protein
MEVAIFDAYVRKPDGSTAHFDIIVPKEITFEQALVYGKLYLNSAGINGIISSQECQFCHIEDPTPEVRADINRQGYFILEFDDIPAQLPDLPTRRQFIEYLRARSDTHRFANFKGVGDEEIREIIQSLHA